MAEYDLYYAPAQVGQIADCSFRNIDSYAAEEIIEFGVALKRGTNPEKQVLPWEDAITVPVVGIAVFSQLGYRPHRESDNVNYQIQQDVSVMTKGRVWVSTLLNVVAGQNAYVTVTTGAFTNVATNNLLVGKFQSSGTGLVILEVNL